MKQQPAACANWLQAYEACPYHATYSDCCTTTPDTQSLSFSESGMGKWMIVLHVDGDQVVLSV